MVQSDRQRHLPDDSDLCRCPHELKFCIWRCSRYVENVSAEEAPAQQGAWLPQENGYCQWQKGTCSSPFPRQSSPEPVIWRQMDRRMRSISVFLPFAEKQNGCRENASRPAREHLDGARRKEASSAPAAYSAGGETPIRPQRVPGGTTRLPRRDTEEDFAQ